MLAVFSNVSPFFHGILCNKEPPSRTWVTVLSSSNDSNDDLGTTAEDGRYQESNELRNITNGVTLPDSANPHLLYEVGMNIVQKMEGSNAFDLSLIHI